MLPIVRLKCLVLQFAIRKYIKIYRTVILRTVLYGCEALPLTFWEKRRLGVFENTVLRKIFGPKRDNITGSGDGYLMRRFMIYTHQI